MNIRLSIWITLMILSLLFIGTAANYATAIILPVKTRTPYLNDFDRADYTDFTGFRVSDNSSHLLLRAIYGDGWDGPGGDLMVRRWLYFNLVTDYNTYWWSVRYSSVFSFDVDVMSNGYQRVRYEEWFSWDTYYNYSWVTIEDKYFEIAIPLDYLASIATQTDNISNVLIMSVRAGTTVYDYIGAPDVNYYDLTSLRADINVDGDPGDWSGIQPVLVDELRPNKLSSLGIDTREVYVATDSTGEIMYVMVKTSGPLASWLNPIYVSTMIYIDSDGDGSYDRGIVLSGNYVYLYRYYAGGASISQLSATTNNYNVSLSPQNGVFEYAFNMTYLQLLSNTAGFIGGMSYTVYPIPLTTKWQTYLSLVYYDVGVGGHVANMIGEYRQYVFAADNPNIVAFDDVSLKMNVSEGYTSYYLTIIVYNNNPMPWGEVDCIPKFYRFYSNIKYGLDPPIQMNISYTDAELKKYGIIEDFLRPYYFNYVTKSYEPVSNYTVYKSRNMVSLYLDPNEVGGQPIIVLGQPPDARSKLGRTFQGISSSGPAKLFLNTLTGEGYIEVTKLPLMTKEKYRIVFSIEVNNNVVMVLKGTITVTVGGIELKLPITIYIDKVNNKATVVGALSFITF